MTQVSAGVYESPAGDLCTADGTVIVPKAKRQRAEVYSRVVGYLRPVAQWNRGKKEEWKDRVVFRTDSSRAEANETNNVQTRRQR